MNVISENKKNENQMKIQPHLWLKTKLNRTRSCLEKKNRAIYCGVFFGRISFSQNGRKVIGEKQLSIDIQLR